jgi:CHAT domain-containing protein
MRRLTIAALSTLILLSAPFSNPRGRGLYSIGRTPLMTSLLCVGGAPAQVSASERGAAQSVQEPISLEPGKPIERDLSGGQSHSYKITMISGQYLHIAVEQRGIDVAVALFTPDGKKRLAIVADGALQYIPFAALPAPSSGNDKGRNSGAEPQPLFVEHEIVNLPSASTLATLRRETAGRKPAEKSLAVLADPVFTDDDMRVGRNVSKTGAKEKPRSADSDETDIGFQQMTRSGRETGVIGAEGAYGRLLGTRREASAISALVPERDRMQALDFEASRTTALRPELGEYRIVHFATHGLLNNVHPELSGIVLSLVDKEGNPHDGFLRLQDIYNLKLPAELVALSACQTGLGKEIKGEGLIGLTRGFMYAGAPRVVASLWKVDDRATSELMKRFYQGMLGPEALRPAGALRQAQLSIWKQKQWREPYYWAAFVLQGEWK